MGSIIAILLFLLSLITCLLLKFSVVYALVIGYIIFIIYGLIKGHNLIVLIKKYPKFLSGSSKHAFLILSALVSLGFSAFLSATILEKCSIGSAIPWATNSSTYPKDSTTFCVPYPKVGSYVLSQICK